MNKSEIMADAFCLTGPGSRDSNAVVTMEKLTRRQHEILELLAKGYSYKEMGGVLGISPSTVRAHLHSVYGKLRVNSRGRAVVKFHEQRGHLVD